jgi:general secretion pathway protein G
MTPGDPRSRVLSPESRVNGPGARIPGNAFRDQGLGAKDQGPAARRRGGAAGFTLIELMIVITIIGILATISQPMFRNAMLQAREAALRENLYVLRDTIDKFYADNDKYPENLGDLVEKRYVRRMPKDPITGSAETWLVVYYTDDKGQQAGIMDVRSGAEATGSDGQKYSEW